MFETLSAIFSTINTTDCNDADNYEATTDCNDGRDCENKSIDVLLGAACCEQGTGLEETPVGEGVAVFDFMEGSDGLFDCDGPSAHELPAQLTLIEGDFHDTELEDFLIQEYNVSGINWMVLWVLATPEESDEYIAYDKATDLAWVPTGEIQQTAIVVDDDDDGWEYDGGDIDGGPDLDLPRWYRQMTIEKVEEERQEAMSYHDRTFGYKDVCRWQEVDTHWYGQCESEDQMSYEDNDWHLRKPVPSTCISYWQKECVIYEEECAIHLLNRENVKHTWVHSMWDIADFVQFMSIRECVCVQSAYALPQQDADGPSWPTGKYFHATGVAVIMDGVADVWWPADVWSAVEGTKRVLSYNSAELFYEALQGRSQHDEGWLRPYKAEVKQVLVTARVKLTLEDVKTWPIKRVHLLASNPKEVSSIWASPLTPREIAVLEFGEIVKPLTSVLSSEGMKHLYEVLESEMAPDWWQEGKFYENIVEGY